MAKKEIKKGESWRRGYQSGYKEGIIHGAKDATAEIIKACGGCKKCWGKGYGTQIIFTRSTPDFEGAEGEVITRQPSIVFCKCARAKTLKEIFTEILARAESMRTAREVRHLLKEYLLS